MSPANWTACETLSVQVRFVFLPNALKSWTTLLAKQLCYHKIDTSAGHNRMLLGIYLSKSSAGFYMWNEASPASLVAWEQFHWLQNNYLCKS